MGEPHVYIVYGYVKGIGVPRTLLNVTCLETATKRLNAFLSSREMKEEYSRLELVEQKRVILRNAVLVSEFKETEVAS